MMTDPDSTAQNLPFRMHRTTMALRIAMSHELTAAFGEDFTVDYWQALKTLCTQGRMSPASLARTLHRDRASMLRTLGCMERMGLVSRIRGGRSHIVEPTPMGHDFMPKADRAVQQALGGLEKLLNPFEINEMSRILDSIFHKY
ncbi:MAG: hypothetical protein IJU72_08565 [Bacteroidales bacterium]|nr:hypothetical protein [Bacteroidales bacterium]